MAEWLDKAIKVWMIINLAILAIAQIRAWPSPRDRTKHNVP